MKCLAYTFSVTLKVHFGTGVERQAGFVDQDVLRPRSRQQLPDALARRLDAPPQPSGRGMGLEPHPDRVGPRHAGVIGRKAGSIAGFAYSPALARSQIVWTEESLERWLRDPEALVPGQRMNFRLGDAEERRRIVEYLSRNR